MKKIIKDALKNAKTTLAKEGFELVLDEDTRGRVGNRDIVRAVLDKIEKCDIFLADVTPVATMYKDVKGRLPKHLPNSNVMFEYGYALHSKGESRMITVAKLTRDEHVEYMPFDINHNTLTVINSADDLSHLAAWIKNIAMDVEKERAAFVPEYACDLMFLGGQPCSQTTIHPQFKKTVYISKKQQEAFSKMNNGIEAVLNPSMRMAELVQGVAKAKRKVQVFNVGQQQVNKSYCSILLWFVNKGNSALDNCNLTIKASDYRVRFAETNVEQILNSVFRKPSNTFLFDNNFTFHVNTLNPGDATILDTVFVHAPHDIGSFKLNWSLSSRTLRDSGTLDIVVEPDYTINYVENEDKVGTEEVKDLIVTENN